MRWLDDWIESRARTIARSTSRRGFLGRMGAVLVGTAALPLLPVARAAAADSDATPTEGDPNICEYWRYCGMDGYLCGCCGGSHTSCPPGTEMSPITWVGSCRNPVDGRNYIVSYNDCCGKSSCGRCLCSRNEGDKALYYPAKSNDINWCQGTTTNVYHCSTAIVVGVAAKS